MTPASVQAQLGQRLTQEPGASWTPTVTLSPAGSEWAAKAVSPPPAASARFREQMGLTQPPHLPQRRVVMSGHQAEIWHAGILTKMMALREVAARAGAASAWVLVDQDTNEPGRIRYPSKGKQGLSAALWEISATNAEATDVPVAARDVFTERELEPHWPEPAATGAVACGLGAIRDAFLNGGKAGSLAGQVIAATRELLRHSGDADLWVRAMAIGQTDLFNELVDAMATDSAKCIRAYNAAVSRHPEAGMAPLGESRGELPLWRIRAGVARGRVTASTLGARGNGELAARALLMTGILRYAGCDLFVHGLGGGKYDVVTEEWLGEWMGWTLAPAVVATGTVLARLTDEPPPSPADVAKARWSLHHARHTPAALGDSWSQRRKEELVDEIRGARKRGEDPAGSFRSLQELLSRVRVEHSDAISKLTADAGRLIERSVQSRMALDRTWAFPLHEPAAIAELADAVRRAFGP